MALEDFERALAQESANRTHRKRSRPSDEQSQVAHKRRHRHERPKGQGNHTSHGEHLEKRHHVSLSEEREDGMHDDTGAVQEHTLSASTQCDAWMQKPSSSDIEVVHRKDYNDSDRAEKTDSMPVKGGLRRYGEEIEYAAVLDNQSTQGIEKPSHQSADYTFGDSSSHWRMTRLKAVYRQAKESGRSVDDVAQERYGDLRDFDDAREEKIELDRRERYGEGYVSHNKPTGELFQSRKLENGIAKSEDGQDASQDEFETAQVISSRVKSSTGPVPTIAVPLDQTGLNRLKAQMMKAKLKNAPDFTTLEAAYQNALAGFNDKAQPPVLLSKMESRMLAGRQGEVKAIDNKRGRERGTVEENEDMSIEDMVRHERRTRGQASANEGRMLAERIAKDGRFQNDLEYIDDNANKLSKSVAKSDINLRNVAIEDYRKTKAAIEACPLCHHEDLGTMPQAPIVALATRVYLTLPTSPEITPYGLCATIVPLQHRANLLDCDDDEWEEIRNFMKALSRFYFANNYTVIFYENAAYIGRARHAALEAVPLPLAHGEQAPAFFKEAILAADEEWTQHRKIIDTLAKSKQSGFGRLAFRKSMVSELPYFHVWFTIDGGLGHVVEDARRWPRGDLFAREIIGGMLDIAAEIVKRQGKWSRGDAEMSRRVGKFHHSGWSKFDWTAALVDAI